MTPVFWLKEVYAGENRLRLTGFKPLAKANVIW